MRRCTIILALFFVFLMCCYSINCEWIKIAQPSSIDVNSETSSDVITPDNKFDLLNTLLDNKHINIDEIKDIIGPNFENEYRKYQEKYIDDFNTKYKNQTYLMPSLTSSSSSLSSLSHDNNNNYFINDMNTDFINYLKTYELSSSTIANIASGTTRHIINLQTSSPFQSTDSLLLTEHVTQTENPILITTSTTENHQHHYLIDDDNRSHQFNNIKTQNDSKISNIFDLNSIFQLSSIFPAFINFLQTIQKHFMLNTAHNIQDKIKFLTNLKDQLISDAEQRINSLWPNKLQRNKRSIMDGNHGMEFPSSEGALMTISFLTFAVFLIKLVLMVINTIKSKHYNFNSFDALTPSTGTGSAIKVIKRNQNARHLTADELKKLGNGFHAS